MRSFALGIIAAIAAVATELPAQQGLGTITGIVTSAESGGPLEGVRVSVEGSLLATATSVRGTYRLTGVVPGTRNILLQGIRRVPLRRTVTVEADRPLQLDLAMTEAVINLDEVVITASREEQLKSEIPAAITTVSHETVDQTRPHHPAELMSQVPGALVVDLGGEGSTMALRLPINYAPVYGYLEDGVPIRSTGFFNHNALYEVNVPGSGGVEVLKGPGTALYGSDAIGGVVNVLTRSPSVEPSAELFLEGGRFGYARTLVSGSGMWGSNGLRVDGNITRYDGYRAGTEQKREGGTLRWGHLFGGNDRVKTVVAFSRINSPGDGGSDLDRADFEDHPTDNLTPIAFRRVRAVRWSTAYEHLGGTTLFLVTPYARYNRLSLLPSWQLTYDPEVWDIENYSVGMLLQGRRDFVPLRSSLIAGVDFDYSPGTHVSDSITPTRNGAVFASYAKSGRIYDYDVAFRGISPYAQLELSPMPRVRITAGLRYDHVGYSYDNQLGVLQSGNHRRPGSADVTYDHLSPKLGVALALSPTLSAFASYRHAFRTPSEDQLFRQGSADETVNLKPVKAESHEAGLRGSLAGRLSFEISGYMMTIRDDILSFFNTVDFSSQTSNAGKSRHRGVEVGVGLGLTSFLRLESAYSYSEHEYLAWVTATGSDFSGNEIESAPRHLANTRLVFSGFRQDGSAVAEWQHTGGFFTDPDNQHRYDGHDLINLYVTAPVVSGLSLVGRVNNVANTRYAVTASFNPFVPVAEQERFTPGLPRTFFVGAQYRWSK